MEKKRQVKFIAVFAILIAISGMGFSFASMSTKLDIKGFATMGSANWDVHFNNLSHATLIGDAIEIEHPTITDNSTSISTYDVRFQKSQDGISYQFDIVNDGGMDAKITTLDLAKPICEGSGANKTSDELLVCENLDYSLTYLDGEELRMGDVLEKGKTTRAQIKLTFKGLELPIEEVRIKELGITIIYSQN